MTLFDRRRDFPLLPGQSWLSPIHNNDITFPSPVIGINMMKVFCEAINGCHGRTRLRPLLNPFINFKKDLMTYFEEISFEREAHDNSH